MIAPRYFRVLHRAPLPGAGRSVVERLTFEFIGVFFCRGNTQAGTGVRQATLRAERCGLCAVQRQPVVGRGLLHRRQVIQATDQNAGFHHIRRQAKSRLPAWRQQHGRQMRAGRAAAQHDAAYIDAVRWAMRVKPGQAAAALRHDLTEPGGRCQLVIDSGHGHTVGSEIASHEYRVLLAKRAPVTAMDEYKQRRIGAARHRK